MVRPVTKYIHNDPASVRGGVVPFPCTLCDKDWCYKHRPAALDTTGSSNKVTNTVVTLGIPWSELILAMRNIYSANQTITIWYSFMLANNTVVDSPGPGITTETIQGTSPVISHTDFGNEITASLNEWKELFEFLFSQSVSQFTFTLNFERRDVSGDEQGIAVSSSVFASPYSLTSGNGLTNLVGDLRFAMIPIDGPSSVLAYAYSPSGVLNMTGDVGGDTRIDADEQWRLDSTSIANTISAKMVTVHEVGHNMGLGHDPDSASIMFAFLPPASQNFSQKFPAGLKDSVVDRFSLNALYAGAGTVIVTGRDNLIYVRNGIRLNNLEGTSWTRLTPSQIMNKATIGANGQIYGVRGGVYTRVGISAENQFGTSFQLIAGNMTDASVGYNNELWAVSSPTTLRARYRQGVTVSNPSGTSWVGLSGDIWQYRTIQVGPYGSVWAIDLRYRIFFREGKTSGNPRGTSWSVVAGGACDTLKIGYLNQVYVITRARNLYRRVGIGPGNLKGTGWSKISSGIRDVAPMPNGYLWAIGTDLGIYLRTGISAANLNGTGWTRVSGSGIAINAGYFRPGNTASP